MSIANDNYYIYNLASDRYWNKDITEKVMSKKNITTLNITIISTNCQRLKISQTYLIFYRRLNMDKEINFDYEVTLKMRVKRSSIVKNIEKEEEKEDDYWRERIDNDVFSEVIEDPKMEIEDVEVERI
ncbi:hypothetical protein CoNPh27_CDS0022 [Staphylococcus phage S-CoN_Ph27]|nr:hypothetical protein CoNPh27_CDS0022 [Staphylococcus phage S-CoN_Ph27]